jgi:hypothetical protein
MQLRKGLLRQFDVTVGAQAGVVKLSSGRLIGDKRQSFYATLEGWLPSIN